MPSKSEAKRLKVMQSQLPFSQLLAERNQLVLMLLQRGWEQLGDTMFVAPGGTMRNLFTFVNAVQAELKAQDDYLTRNGL